MFCHETIRYWWNKLGPLVSKKLKKKQPAPSKWRWHIDEVFIKINGQMHYLWRAVDHEGTIIDCYVSKRRNRHAAFKFLRKAIARFGPPKQIITDKLKSYKAALQRLNIGHLQETQPYKNNRIENSPYIFDGERR